MPLSLPDDLLPVYQSIRQSARDDAEVTLGHSPGPATVLRVVSDAHTTADGLSDAALARGAGHLHPACRAGCSWCCTLRVEVTPPEALLVVEHLRSTRSPAALAAVATRVAETDARTRGLNTTERAAARLPCPLLEDGRCSVYSVRPLACRTLNSLDASACEEAYDTVVAGGADPGIPVNSYLSCFPLAVGRGLRDALLARTRSGVSGPQAGMTAGDPEDAADLVELVAALHIALETTDAAVRWLAGEPIFVPASADRAG